MSLLAMPALSPPTELAMSPEGGQRGDVASDLTLLFHVLVDLPENISDNLAVHFGDVQQMREARVMVVVILERVVLWQTPQI